ncbi:MAG: hypothetical protein FWF59_13640 [Turicibacter sp.]|nr:hypothetical protein [Turicibacter sp.]
MEQTGGNHSGLLHLFGKNNQKQSWGFLPAHTGSDKVSCRINSAGHQNQCRMKFLQKNIIFFFFHNCAVRCQIARNAVDNERGDTWLFWSYPQERGITSGLSLTV